MQEGIPFNETSELILQRIFFFRSANCWLLFLRNVNRRLWLWRHLNSKADHPLLRQPPISLHCCRFLGFNFPGACLLSSILTGQGGVQWGGVRADSDITGKGASYRTTTSFTCLTPPLSILHLNHLIACFSPSFLHSPFDVLFQLLFTQISGSADFICVEDKIRSMNTKPCKKWHMLLWDYL